VSEGVFRFRLRPGERDRLDREAAAKGLSKADLIREALGWECNAAPSLPPSAAALGLVAKAPVGADPEAEPGKAALEGLAKRIHGRDGVPMRVARQRAKEQSQP
jgi:hypothetical protein